MWKDKKRKIPRHNSERGKSSETQQTKLRGKQTRCRNTEKCSTNKEGQRKIVQHGLDAVTWSHPCDTVCEPTLREEEMSLFRRFVHSFISFLSFQNDHELQTEGDPGSSVRTEPTPTLHVSKYSIFDNHVSRAFKRFIMICNAWQLVVYGYRRVSVEQKMMRLIETGFRKIVALPLLSQQPHILNETSIICLG